MWGGQDNFCQRTISIIPREGFTEFVEAPVVERKLLSWEEIESAFRNNPVAKYDSIKKMLGFKE